MKFIYTLLLPLIVIGSFLLVPSCKPEDPPKLVVTAVDSTGKKIAGALILISSSGNVNGVPKVGVVKEQGTTDGAGTASFDFKLDAVVRIDATVSVGGGDSLRGTSNAKLITGETTEATVLLK
jgi:hypothetical protein